MTPLHFTLSELMRLADTLFKETCSISNMNQLRQCKIYKGEAAFLTMNDNQLTSN